MRNFDYKVIKASGTGYIDDEAMRKFTEEVKYAIQYGWVCAGGVSSVCSNGNTVYIFQALIKEGN
jgi:hypothetical protein